MARAVTELFDRIAAGYDDVLPFFAEFGKVIAVGLPAPGPGAGRLLDVGTGRGALALPPRALGYQVTAIDASAAMVARLAAGHPDLEVRLMDAAQLGGAWSSPAGRRSSSSISRGIFRQAAEWGPRSRRRPR